MPIRDNYNILLFASDLGACIGKNRYKSRNDALLQYWKRYDEESFKKYKFATEVKDEIASSAKRDDYEKLLSTELASVTDIDGVVDSIAKLAEGEIDTHRIKDYARGELNKRFGTHHEDEVTECVGKMLQLDISKTNKFVKKMIGNVDGIKVLVGGRLDGYDAKTDTIFEIKNRMRGLVGVPEYEKVQLMTYMYIMEKKTGMLVERHKTDVKMHTVEFDEGAWEKISEECLAFAKDLLDIMRDESKQKEFVSFGEMDDEEDEV